MKKPESIGRLLDGIIARKKWSRKLDLHQVFVFWKEVVGDDVARWAKPTVIRGRVLWIAVVDSVWMQQLYMQKMLLLDKINERLPAPGFTDLRFRVDSNMVYAAETEPEKKTEPALQEPSRQDREAFEKALGSISDPEVRKAFFNYWYKVKKVRNE